MKYAEQIRIQLESIVDTLSIDATKINMKLQPPEFEDPNDYVLWTLAQGSWIKTAILDPDKLHYRTILEKQKVKIHLSSVINRTKLPNYIVYDECVSTSTTYVRIVSSLDKFDIRKPEK